MTPYFEAEHVTIYCADARELLPDLLLTIRVAGLISDPPYVNYRHPVEAGFTTAFVDTEEGEWWASVISWACRWLPLCRAAMTEAPLWLFIDHRYLPLYLRMIHICRWGMQACYEAPPEELLLQIGGPDPSATEKLVLADLAKRLNRYGHDKDPALLDALVATIPRGPGVLLDPFMGDGSTLLAGLRAGWPVVGIERDEDVCARAVAAIQAAQVAA